MLFKTVWFLYPTVHMRDIIQVYCFSMGLTLLLLTVPSRDGEIIKGCFMVKTYYNTAEPIVADNPYRVSPFFVIASQKNGFLTFHFLHIWNYSP